MGSAQDPDSARSPMAPIPGMPSVAGSPSPATGQVLDEDLPPAEQATGQTPMAPQYLAQGYGAMGPPSLAASPQMPAPVVTAQPNPAPMAPPPNPAVVTVPGRDGRPVQVVTSALSQPLGGGPSLARMARQQDAENKQTLKNFTTAEDAQRQAVNAAARVDEAQANANAAEQSQYQTNQAALDAQETQRQDAYQKTIGQRNAQIDQLTAEQGQQVFDPGRYMKNLNSNFGQRMMTAIAVALSGMGSSTKVGGNGQNLATQMLNQSIEADVNAQREEYARKGNQVDAAKNAYARAKQMGMDDHQAYLAAKQMSTDNHIMATQTIGAKYAAQHVVANRDKTLADLQTASAKNRQELNHTFHAEGMQAGSAVEQQYQNRFQQGVALRQLDQGDERLALEKRNQDLDYDAKLAKLNGKGGGGIAGWTGEAPTQEQKNKAAEVIGAYESIAPLLQKMKEFREKHSGGTIFNRAAVGEAQAMHEGTLLEVKNLAQLGVLSESDIELVNHLIGPPPDSETITDARYNAQINQAAEYMQKKAYAQMRAYGYTPTKDSDPLGRMIHAEPIEGSK